MAFLVGSDNGDTQCVNITIIDDDDVEGDHSFTLTGLNAFSPGIIGSQSEATVIISDNGNTTK